MKWLEMENIHTSRMFCNHIIFPGFLCAGAASITIILWTTGERRSDFAYLNRLIQSCRSPVMPIISSTADIFWMEYQRIQVNGRGCVPPRRAISVKLWRPGQGDSSRKKTAGLFNPCCGIARVFAGIKEWGYHLWGHNDEECGRGPWRLHIRRATRQEHDPSE